MTEKKHWNAEHTSYRGLHRDTKEAIALVYDPTPGGWPNGDGTTTYSLRFPALLVTDIVGDAEKVAGQIAESLNVAETLTKPRPLDEWHDDMGDVLWWCWEPPKAFEQISEHVVSSAHNGRWLGEPPYVGTPNDLGHTVEIEHSILVRTHARPQGNRRSGAIRHMVGGWPGYHTHFTPLPPMPKAPK